jgi:hypothetical protein
MLNCFVPLQDSPVSFYSLIQTHMVTAHPLLRRQSELSLFHSLHDRMGFLKLNQIPKVTV